MPECTRCGAMDFWILGTGQIRCKQCGLTRFPHRSYWKQSRIPPYWKGRLLEFFCFGVPAYRLRFQVPLNLKTIQRWYHLMRLCIYHSVTQELSKLAGTIEMDETMFGGRKPGKRGWGAEGKILVFGMYKRNGLVVTFPISSRSKQELLPLISAHTKPGSLYYTDDWHAYASLAVRGNHIVITKEKGVPKGRNHINAIEGFWSYAKHWLYQYRGVPKDYFQLYLKEIEWRFNNRGVNLIPLLRKMLKQPFLSSS
jgi:transposase